MKGFVEGLNKLSNIISINGFQKYQIVNNSSRSVIPELEGVIQGVQCLIAGALVKTFFKEIKRTFDFYRKKKIK